jgi:hypothetical protein
VPRADVTRPEEGVGAGRGSRDWEDAMATRADWAKNSVRASGSSGAARGTHRSSALSSSAGVGKMRPSAEKWQQGLGGSRDWEDAMATRADWAKNSIRASGSSGAARGTHRSGALSSSAGVAKMRPSAEKCPRGRSAKKCRACCQGAPIRSVCRKAHRTAGYGRGGVLQAIESAQTAAEVTGRAVHRAGARHHQGQVCI